MPTLALLGRGGTAAAPSVGAVALKYARSNIMRAGASRADYYQPIVSCTIGGTRRETLLHQATLSVTQNLNAQPDTMTVMCHSFTPVIGQEIVIGLGAIDNRFFAGHVMTVRAQQVTAALPPIYTLDCIDYTWELGHKRVRGRKFVNTAVNQIVASLLSDYASNFSIYGSPFGFTSVDFQSNDDETVTQAITRAMGMIDGDWYVDNNRKVHLFQDPETTDLALTNTTAAWQIDYSEDMSQVRSRTAVRGGTTTTTAAASVSASSIQVDDTRLFGSTGGLFLAGGNYCAYTGKSVTEGPGSLTGIPTEGDTSIRYDIAQGESVRVYALETNAGAVAQIAATLGSSHNGLIDYSISDGNNGAAAAVASAQSDLSHFGVQAEKRLSLRTRNKTYMLGRDIVATVTSPLSIMGRFQIQTITISDFPGTVMNNYWPERQVQAGINRNRDATQVLAGLL